MIWQILLIISAAFALYSIVGYVVVLRLIAMVRTPWQRPPARPTPSARPRVSLIIPAYNEEVVLDAKLVNSLNLDYPRDLLEIVVASDGSTDRTTEIARRYADQDVVLLDFPTNRGKSSTLNDAVSASRGEVLCLCDANVMFQSDALAILVDRLADSKVGAVTGDVRLQNGATDFDAGESLYYRIERAIQILESKVGSTICVDGGMYVMRRELFRPLPADTVLDDFKTSINVLKAGGRVVYEPLAVASETGTPSSSDEFRRRVRLAAGSAQSLCRGDIPSLFRPLQLFSWVSHKLLRWLSPFWLLLLLISSLRLQSEHWSLRVLLVVQVLFYLSAIVAWLVPSARFYRPLRITFYFALSQVAMLCGLLKGMLMTQSGVWRRTARVLPKAHDVPSA